MSRWIYLVIALSLQTAWSLTAHAEPMGRAEEMSLSVGENRTISAVDVKSYSEGVSGVAEVKVTPGGQQFIVVGHKPGTTTLLLILKNGSEVLWKINVFAQPVHVVESELTELLGDTTGIRVRRVGARFFIEGGVTTEPELQRIQHIASLYQGQVESLVVLGGVAADRKINVRIDLYFVQYSKTKNMKVGVSWPGAIGGASFSQASFVYDILSRATRSAQASLVNQPLPGLDLAARNGWAKVLKHSTVITSNGSEAEFANGGAQWFAAANGLTSSLREINFGTNMKILPRYDPKSREMQVQVTADVADLVPSLSPATDLPGQQTSKLTTNVALKLGQSIVLSGIRTELKRHETDGLPWLSQIPILGALFGSVGVQNEETEGAVFVVPSVVESVPRRASELVDGAMREFKRFNGDMGDVAPFATAPVLKQETKGAAR
ncbi:MAG: pilus assembly protein N-terminal domain-containing protein [Polyangiales bacterium]